MLTSGDLSTAARKEKLMLDPLPAMSNMPMCQRMAKSSSGSRRMYQLTMRQDFSPWPKGKASFTS